MNLDTFLYNIFSSDTVRRRQLIKLWHSPYPVDKKRHVRLCDVFEEFLTNVLYEPCTFKMRSDHFCCLSRGSDTMRIPYIMLEKQERSFLVQLFEERKEHFSIVKIFANNEFNFETTTGFTFKQTWKREIVREFGAIIGAMRNGWIQAELIAAVQRIMLKHLHGKRDLFLSAFHYGLQNGMVKEVPCWNLDWYDRHEEDVEQSKSKLAAQVAI